MPYARPSMLQTNGTPFSSETRFSSVEPSTCDSSTQNDDHSPSLSSPAWQNRVSASFSQLSKQFQAASQAVSTIPPSSDHAMVALMERLENIEEGQRTLALEIKTLKEQFLIKPEPSTDLETSLKEQIELFKLDRDRLPFRLHNALATKSPSPIKMPPMRNGKFPPNVPSTRGEFEHLTKERYEGLMTNYDIPISGDTAAKRESLRAFLGIPSNPPEKK